MIVLLYIYIYIYVEIFCFREGLHTDSRAESKRITTMMHVDEISGFLAFSFSDAVYYKQI